MKIRASKLTAENFFTFFLILFWGQDILFSYVKAVFMRVPLVNYFAEYIIPFTMLTFLLLSVPYFAKAIFPADILFTAVVVIIVLLDIIIFPENESLMALSGTFFVSVFPLYFIGLRFEPSKHFKIIYVMSIINVWAFATYYLFIGGSPVDGAQAGNESFMGRAYVLLPQLLVTILGFLRKKNLLNTITGIMGIVLLLMCGNRGSVVLMLLFVLLNFLFNAEKMRVHMYVGAVSLFGVFAYYYEALFALMTQLFIKLGMSVRVFERLTDGSFFESNGRNAIIEKLKVAIWDNPFIGYGLCSDRTITGSYAHNYAYELWTAFGVILGSILLIATIAVIVGAWFKSKDVESRGVLLVLTCVGFLKLFISSSFLLEGLFFMLVGYCVKLLRMNKAEVIE